MLRGPNLSVCEFGNQRLDKSLLRPGVRTTKEFYALMGFSHYVALDVNERMDAVVCDLNQPVDFGAIGEHDLVVDNGTGEHLFDQFVVWSNHHRLTKQGGILLKIMPFTPWFNHGFYNFNPILYRDIANANNYAWLFFWINDRESLPVDLDCSYDSPMFLEKRPRELTKHALGRGWKTDLYMVAAWRKLEEDLFRVPLQGKYVRDVQDAGLKKVYGVRHADDT